MIVFTYFFLSPGFNPPNPLRLADNADNAKKLSSKSNNSYMISLPVFILNDGFNSITLPSGYNLVIEQVVLYLLPLLEVLDV